MEHVGIVISSCVVLPQRFNFLCETIVYLRKIFPSNPIFVGFDNFGPSEDHIKVLSDMKNVEWETHRKGLGYSFNRGWYIMKEKGMGVVLQTEDDWLIHDKTTVLKACQLVLDKENVMVRFSDPFDAKGYPNKMENAEEFRHVVKPYRFDIPKGRYIYCNHPHVANIRWREIVGNFKENCEPPTVEITMRNHVNDLLTRNVVDVYFTMRSIVSIIGSRAESARKILEMANYIFSPKLVPVFSEQGKTCDFSICSKEGVYSNGISDYDTLVKLSIGEGKRIFVSKEVYEELVRINMVHRLKILLSASTLVF